MNIVDRGQLTGTRAGHSRAGVTDGLQGATTCPWAYLFFFTKCASDMILSMYEAHFRKEKKGMPTGKLWHPAARLKRNYSIVQCLYPGSRSPGTHTF